MVVGDEPVAAGLFCCSKIFHCKKSVVHCKPVISRYHFDDII